MKNENKNSLVKFIAKPTEVPDWIYIALEDLKFEKYGGLWSPSKEYIAFTDGQCAAIDLIEKWLKSL
jgi:hypothetical protein